MAHILFVYPSRLHQDYTLNGCQSLWIEDSAGDSLHPLLYLQIYLFSPCPPVCRSILCINCRPPGAGLQNTAELHLLSEAGQRPQSCCK